MLLVLLFACSEPPKGDTGPVDADGDGFTAAEDCDDGDADVHIGAVEQCNGHDDNCDGHADEGVLAVFYTDGDGDGYGAGGGSYVGCEPPAGYAEGTDDCDDDDADIHPDAEEDCNGVDDDCDGVADDTSATWYTDADGDGFGDDATAVYTCLPTEGQVLTGGDCDDVDAAVNPSADEACDGDDDNCDGRADAGVSARWYHDADGDGYGNPSGWVDTCDPEPDYVTDGSDCDPEDATIFPGAVETCNEADDDCDGATDEDFDADGDGSIGDVCSYGDDCDDTNPSMYPGAQDACEDGIDDDCDGSDPVCGLEGEWSLGDVDAKITGTMNDDLGRQIAFGDVTGDGVDDLVAATLYYSGLGGGGFVLPGPILEDAAAVDAGHRLAGSRITYGAGRSVGVGDVDGDGVGDVGFGAPYGSANGMFVVLGPITADARVEDTTVHLQADTGTYAGHGADVGDINGDGIEDAVVGAYADNTAANGAGAVFVKYGPLAGEIDLPTDAELVLYGEDRTYYTGRWVRGDGDIDGDGLSDVLAASLYASIGAPQAGAVYLVYGGTTGEVDLADADGRFFGTSASEYAGYGIGFGDLDGDGKDDVLVGSMASTGAPSGGATYVIYGAGANGDHALDESDVIVYGDTRGQILGASIAAGDLDGDGTGDLASGAEGDNTAGGQAGAAFVFYGLESGTYTTADADASLLGEARADTAGTCVRLVDLDADGFLELAIGAPMESTGGAQAGAVYLHEPGR